MKWWLRHTGQQAAQDHDPQKKRKQKVSPTVMPAYCVEVVSRPQYRKGNPNQTQGSCSVVKMEFGVWGGKSNYNLWGKISARWELCRERSGDLQSVSPAGGQGLLCVYVEEATWVQGKNYCRTVSRNSQRSPMAWNSLYSHQPKWKDLIMHRALVRSSKRYCFTSGAKSSLD